MTLPIRDRLLRALDRDPREPYTGAIHPTQRTGRFTNWMARFNDPNPADRPTPLVCLCPTPDPEPCGQCARCLRRIAWYMSPANRVAALRAHPELADQSVTPTRMMDT